jgi:hypothetical protein
MLTLVANSVFAQSSHEIYPEYGWIGGFRGRITHFCLRGRRSGEFATSINSDTGGEFACGLISRS